MLVTLRVKNLALAAQARVDFGPGLNVITGETGAGKSLLVGGLGLVLGQRADRNLIRTGEEACGAEALFQLHDPSDVDALLEAQGLPPCESGQLIVRRIVKAAGGGQCFVNDSAVTVQTLHELGERLVDMHGPYDHQSLLRTEAQVELLDAFGHLWEAREAYEEAYAAWRALLRERDALSAGSAAELAAQMDLLNYRVQEIEEAALAPDEESALQVEQEVLGQSQRIQELAGRVLQAFDGEEASIYEALVSVHGALVELARLLPEGEDWLREGEALTAGLQALSRSILDRVERLEGDGARLEWLDQRLATYQRLQRKYQTDVPGLLELLGDARTRLQDLGAREERLAAIGGRVAAAESLVRQTGATLSGKRRRAGRQLALAIEGELKALGLLKSAFAVDLGEAEPGPSGLDRIEFLFAPNPGEAQRPLRVIASSGEISRVMLACKAVLANHDRIPVLVFDEIDRNVGGETGLAVGRKLAEVACRHQVLCITHLPQVAVFGGAHFVVSKRVEQDRTFSEVVPVAEDHRVDEVARMLGGVSLTPLTRAHARELLEKAAAETAGGGQ
ncbi:MAG: DNA repair protein RecN [Candidatus Marinimicrobia bacterium]|nr:DNA repair protein RecN [Candidatus Neomarinimicrobiota bacterium]